MLGSIVVVVASSHHRILGLILRWRRIFSPFMDCSGYNPRVWGDHSTIRFSWVTDCGWSEAILHNAVFITTWVPVKKWGWLGSGWVLSARVKERGVGGETLGWSRCCSPIWSKKQVESEGTVVQGYVDGLLQLGGEPGWCFVSKSIGEWLCVKGDLGVGS